MNSEAVSALIAKNPLLKASKAQLEAMEPGSYGIHRSWGFGQIKSYDESSQKLIIDFNNKKGHPMDPAFCIGTLQILPANHLLVRKQTEPSAITKLIAEDPAQLLVDGLQAYPNNAATAIEIEITLAQVVGEEKFKKWWSAAKKAIAKDPRIAVPAKKTECYVLREVPVSAEDEIIEQFNATRSARRRIALAEDLVAASGSKEVKGDLNVILAGLTESVKESNQLDTAERLYGAFVRDALAKQVGVDPATLVPSQAELIGNTRDLVSIAEKIPVQFQGRFLDLVKDTHPIEYRDAAFTLLKTSQGKFTTECINFLVEHGHSDELAASLKRWQIEQNLRAPVLLWIVKNRHSKKFAKLLNDLITPRLLSAVFFAIDYEALQAASARRIPLGDILSEDTDLIADLLSTADPETARDLANALMLNQGFEELTKKSLLARFIKIFPGIQSIVAKDAESTEEQILVSRESYEIKRVEYETIVSKKIPENSKAIATAREHGDLKENSEYKMAKQDQTILMAQKSQLERELSRARITDFKEATVEQVSVGSVIEVSVTSTGKTAKYTLLGAWDSVPEKNILAYKTPLGLGLLGKKVGDSVKVKIGTSEETYTLKSIGRYIDSR
ncbi:MAG: GreA/GreB family elongation factor [Opitutus sp.]|nr:GreA/GreB family elongation factor [Opitutus sp.]MCS6247931.1 GreA/GreB family elongation factor [Opitutus sp.]MCS6274384.1 GreA/GreB family elongation factor [Opitutus sp.]MCS6277203.1 GreA/GreB family elongation factor [Opitutus sp.]MCS6300325.1 GreA/GreB family elongation factor [Opitutus sp.]